MSEDTAVTVLPDGSAFSVASYPLPADHWSTAEVMSGEAMTGPCSGTACPPESRVQRYLYAQLQLASRVGYRGASMKGKVSDIDPDALTQNIGYAMLGPLGEAQPDPINPVSRPKNTYPIGRELLTMIQLCIMDGIITPEEVIESTLPENMSITKEAFDNWEEHRRVRDQDVEQTEDGVDDPADVAEPQSVESSDSNPTA